MTEHNMAFNYDPSQITCPVLILIGEGEYESSSYIQGVQQKCIKALPNPESKLVIAPTSEGAAHHCLPDNPVLAAQAASAFYLGYMGFRWSPVRIRPPRLLKLKWGENWGKRRPLFAPFLSR